MNFKLSIQENAIDSFNEALEKYREGEAGKLSAYKFSILHMAHFLELTLKMYVQTLDENLVYDANFQKLRSSIDEKKPVSLLDHFKARQQLGDKYTVPPTTLKGPPKTILVQNAIELAKNETCSRTGGLFVDQDFIDDINWLKALRNNIEHFHFQMNPKDVRLCIGRIVRRAAEFTDIFSLFVLADQINKKNAELYEVLVDEYQHKLKEAKLEVEQKEYEAFRGIRQKFLFLVDWKVLDCPNCNEDTLVPEESSGTGYRCANCGNEDSDQIEIPCDCCGALTTIEDLESWPLDEGGTENRCEFCSGSYAMSQDRS